MEGAYWDSPYPKTEQLTSPLSHKFEPGASVPSTQPQLWRVCVCVCV